MPAKFTNKHNLPESFVNAVLVDEHVSLGDISVTQLIDAPQVRMLKKTNNYTIDVMDMIGMVMGTGMHTVLERGDMKGSFDSRILQRAAAIFKEHKQDKVADYILEFVEKEMGDSINKDVIVEKTLTMEVLGWVISGTFDRYFIPDEHLQDYKQTGASSVMFPETKKAWDAQQNIYAVMMRDNGMPVKKATIIAVLKDWTKMKIMTSRDYPKTPVIMHEINLLENDRVLKYIESRVKLHQRAEAGENIPCTPKDRWAKPDVYAVKLEGGKRALKLCMSQAEAEAHIEKVKAKHTKPMVIEFRKGQSFRCANGYCPVSDFCPQYAKEKEEAAQDAANM